MVARGLLALGWSFVALSLVSALLSLMPTPIFLILPQAVSHAPRSVAASSAAAAGSVEKSKCLGHLSWSAWYLSSAGAITLG
ncbi:hypothetical protein [Sphingomonas sp. S2-65]|uniref:hypothetical protein n=1 Tax=Sphingomonas sp. S2-65 TaxID=2903960 RepID=UPI001F2B494D|nr:hypothetical protein [Sphingomonas sp. S2-65]UYY57190.1 hypothetical protein LZ586_10875 [Sphingomonas sp. S2-65]